MSKCFPQQPGYPIYHNPTIVDYKKASNAYQDKVWFGEWVSQKHIPLPHLLTPKEPRMKNANSLSQDQYSNPYGNDVKELFQPDYVVLDKQVLRFYGYFKESIAEAEMENARVRRLVICYYWYDDTISITDVKQVNSGITQGPFLNKGKVYKENGELITFKDLIVGANVMIYGKSVHIYDCDQYTRDFYSKNQIRQFPQQEVPIDPFLQKVTIKPLIIKDHWMKDYLEYSMGGGKVKSAKQFLENDRKVLRFNAKFEGWKYIIHYYWSDDTVEIREVICNNSGREPFPQLLKRNKLPKKFCIPQPGDIGAFDFYTEADIEPFMTLWAFNRPFKIWGCDEYTAKYYFETFGRNFPVGGFEDPPQKENKRMVIPPYNGFGSEEDSLGNCWKWINKPPKKDYYKYIENDKLIWRFWAKLNTKIKEDIDRRFLISWFVSDDSVQVYELNCRNSGIWEGKFLERGLYKNAENDNKRFTVSDFEIGKSMRINTYSFYIIDGDEFTKKWLIDNTR